MLNSQHILKNAGYFLPLMIAAILMAASPYLDPYLAYVASSWLIFGLLGLSLDIVWGRGGLLSLGQTAFYGLGGYFACAVAINLAPTLGMSLVIALPSGALFGAAIAAALGFVIFYARMGALQSTILTYTATLLVWSLTQSFNVKIGDAVIGGDNGMSNIPGIILGAGEAAEAIGPNDAFAVIVLVCMALYAATRWLMTSTFGRIINCVRLDIKKTELLGYDVRQFQLLNFSYAGAVAGIAGALFGLWSNYLNPSIFSVQEALLVPIYVLVGGLGTLAGPFVGSAFVGSLSFWLGGGAVGGHTTLILGAMLVLLVLFLRKGLLGTLLDFVHSCLAPSSQQPVGSEIVRIDAEILDTLLIEAHQTAGPAQSLSTERAYKRFGGVVPVKNVTRAFKPGKPYALIGPNGAGKSSLLKTCAGIYVPDDGLVLLDNVDITSLSIHRRVALGMGVKNQKPQVFGDLSVFENLWISAYSRERNRGSASSTARKVLQMLGFEQKQHSEASSLSHGEQQWLDIGMILCLAPRVILLDEPAAGMTGEETKELAKLVRILARHTTVIVVEHDMDFVRTLEGHVTVLHQGEVFAEGNINELRRDERVLDIYLGRRQHV
jgi:branched-chain amino acid transport system permease protein